MASRKMLIDGETDPANEENSHTDFDYDLFVIGAGSGGVRAARFSANFGAKVGICELPFHPISSEVVGGVGGTCVIRGCVPKKILVYGAVFGGELQDAKSYGWELNEKIDFNWKNLLHKKTEEILRLNSIYKRLLSSAGVKLLEGEGKVVGPHEVQVTQLDGTKVSYTAKHILIATGSRAQRPNIPGKDGQFNRENFNAGISVRSFPGETLCCAVSASTWVEPQGKSTIAFAVAWSSPKIRFSKGSTYYGTSERAAEDLVHYALTRRMYICNHFDGRRSPPSHTVLLSVYF